MEDFISIPNVLNKPICTVESIRTEVVKIFDQEGKEIFKGTHAELVALIKKAKESYTTSVFVPHSSGYDWTFQPMTYKCEIKIPGST